MTIMERAQRLMQEQPAKTWSTLWLARALGVNTGATRVALSRMTLAGQAERVRRGHYRFKKDEGVACIQRRAHNA